jgi:DNA-binding beta-propeller fold protein YncE
MAFPYDVALAPDQTLYVCEYGNSRVQRFTRAGESLGTWGGPGREPGLLDGPYSLTVDAQAAIHVVDSGNHRVQRFRMPETRSRHSA